MGGDSFQGLEKLSNAQYQQITKELLQRLAPFCQRIEPYIPLPEKEVHGDVDFLMILKPQYQPNSIIEELKIQKYINNNNHTINSVYKNKQVDYCFVKTQKEFQLTSFYKSYSGIGAYLGIFLPSKEIKLNTGGLMAMGFHKHLKLEFIVCDEIEEILKFYGLDYKRYKEGFKTKKELYEFLRGVRFLDEQKYAYHEHKNVTKLINGLVEYLKSTGINSGKKVDTYENVLEQTLGYFNKKQEYKKAFDDLLNSNNRIQQLNEKFNATHLFAKYEVSPKDVNTIKNKFNSVMFNNDKDKYYDWVQAHDIEVILKEFQEKCGLKLKEEMK